MAIQVALYHRTEYQYNKLISLSPQTIRLRPAPHNKNNILAYSLKITPQTHFINWQQDPFANYLARVVFPNKTKSLCVEIDLVADINVFNPFDFFLEDDVNHFPFNYEIDLQEALTPYLEIKERGPLLLAMVNTVLQPQKGKQIVQFLVDTTKAIAKELQYVIRLEPGVQTCEQTLSLKSGSCRDVAWLLCQLLRHVGLATRFCSGYLIQLAPDLEAIDGPSGPTEDFTDLHAWAEVYIPGAGWIGLDGTSGLLAGEGHIPLCCTPSPLSAAPISGLLEPCNSTMNHVMQVTRIKEDFRYSRPYSKAQWQQIDAMGTQVDAAAIQSGIELTIGGEPTFISNKNREGDEWKLQALGDDKAQSARNLLLALGKQYAENGLPFYGQGKWYPGEVLPRWAYAYYWRKDKTHIIKNDNVINTNFEETKANLGDAKKFAQRLAEALAVPKIAVIPAYEDSIHYLWKESKLVTEPKSAQDDAFLNLEKEKIKEVLENSKGEEVGYVLPLTFSGKDNIWKSNAWQFKHKYLILNPGNSAIGYRLPLQSLPYVKAAEEDIVLPRSSLDMRNPLPSYNDLYDRIATNLSSKEPTVSVEFHQFGYVKTALCIEPRAGKYHVFLPPLNLIEHFLELMVAIEHVAANLGIKVILEGYPPPQDLRLQSYKLTPDPGVLEVNIPPSANWNELTAITKTLYETAYKHNLAPEKFLLDGRVVGSGGGNHIVLGAKTPAESPFLQRPDLLKSMLLFWQNHPSLSYLFSSLFIGPTSQAPRIDEARHDSLHALNIAFETIAKDKGVPFWQVDRIFRNILVDVTGNTHRTEFCIDKLYSPDSESGRLGLVEIRCIEMPPHYQMSLLQNLLIKALLVQFWNEPYEEDFIFFGTALHDKYMLPHFLWQDFEKVIVFVCKKFPFSLGWYKAFLEFRFPIYGKVTVGNYQLELRAALEPWPVLGEESAGGSVSRAVDSSIERLQVYLTGQLAPHHRVCCNGFQLPLKSVGSNTYVCGVQYKAWNPPFCLHPLVPAHTPLVFDIVDTLHNRSIGGCTYHVAHPGGRNYDSLPITENEAQGRRLSRFEPYGHTPGDKVLVKLQGVTKMFPHTLDLRAVDFGS